MQVQAIMPPLISGHETGNNLFDDGNSGKTQKKTEKTKKRTERTLSRKNNYNGKSKTKRHRSGNPFWRDPD